MMYTMPKNLLSICVNFTLATQQSFLYDAEQASAVFGRDTFDILDRHSLDLCNLLGHSVNVK